MEIGFYHENAGTRHAGGIAIFVQRMAATLAADHDVSLYTKPGEQTSLLAESDVTVVEIPPTPGTDTATAAAVQRLSPVSVQLTEKLCTFAGALRHGVLDDIEACDVVFTMQWLDDLLLSNAVDVPLVYNFHGLREVGVGTRARERFTATEHNLANSEATAAEVADTLGYEVDDVVHPGVDVDQFTPDAVPAFDCDDPTVLYVGRVVESKGVFDLVDAVGAMDRDATLRIVGRGAVDDARRRARKAGVEDDLVVTGEVAHDDLPGYYTAADVFCLPSHYESCGMVNLEAMACGTPVVTTACPGIEEYATHGENALLFDPGDVDAMASCLDRVLSSAERRATLGDRGRATAERHSWPAQAAKLAEFCAMFADEPVDDAATPLDAVGSVPT